MSSIMTLSSRGNVPGPYKKSFRTGVKNPESTTQRPMEEVQDKTHIT